MATLEILMFVTLSAISLLGAAAGQTGNRSPQLGIRTTSVPHPIAFPGHDVFEQISGYLAVHKCKRPFSAIDVDHEREHNNALMNGKRGAIGLTQNPSAPRRWTVVKPDVLRILDEFPDLKRIRNSTQPPSYAVRPPISSLIGQQNGYYGDSQASKQTSTTPGYYSGAEGNYQSCNSYYSWENNSPFYNTRSQQSQRLPDTRLAIETMFRMANKMESLLREPSINLVYSPIGLTSTLGQLMLAARGETLTELENLLVARSAACNSSDAANRFHLSFQSLVSQIWSRRGSESYELSTRNALFHQSPGKALSPKFTRRLSVEYATEIFPADFRNSPVYTRQQINGWASTASQGKIDQLLPYIPDRSTTAIISSITYFKGQWESKFNQRFTSTAPFYLDGDYRGRVTTINFMKAEMELPYVESKSLGCKLVIMPYKYNETAMYLLMPLGSPKWKIRSANAESSSTTYHSQENLLSTRIAETQNSPAPAQQPVRNTYTNPYYVQLPTPIITAQYNYRSQANYQPVIHSANEVPTTRTYHQAPQRTKRQSNEPSPASATPCETGDTGGSNPCFRSAGESPFSPQNLHELASRIGPSALNSLINEAKRKSPVRVSLIIPKLFMTTNVKLKDALTALGVPSVFSEGANLSGAIEDDRPSGEGGDEQFRQQGNKWLVNEVWQQSRLEVTEDGTEAASGTAAGIVDYNLDSNVFKANSPFLSVIRHEATGAPIFWASVVNPT